MNSDNRKLTEEQKKALELSYPYVFWDEELGKFNSSYWLDGELVHVGYFDSVIEATLKALDLWLLKSD